MKLIQPVHRLNRSCPALAVGHALRRDKYRARIFEHKSDTTPPTPLQQPSTPQAQKTSSFRSLPRYLLGGENTKKKMRTMAGNEVDSRAFEMDYKEFMLRFMKCHDVDEEKETEEIDAIVKKIGPVPKILERTNVKETERYLPLIQLIQPAWDGTDYVARNVCNYKEKSDLKIKRKPDIGPRQDTPSTPHTPDSSSLPSNNAHTVDCSRAPESNACLDEPSPSGSLDRPIADIGPSSDSPVGGSGKAAPSPDSEDMKQKKKKKKTYPPFAAQMTYTACKLTIEDKTAEDSMLGCSLKDLPEGMQRVDACGQIAEHASLAMERQHRTHYFSGITVGTEIRFIRWDRSGVIITTPITFNKDLTREDASILERVEDLRALDDFQVNEVPELVTNHQEFFKDAFVNKKALFPIVKVHLNRIPPVSPSDDQSSDDQSPEHTSKANLAIAEGGGDVKDSRDSVQGTVTDGFLNKKRTKGQKKFLSQKHYQFVIRQVGTPLEKYQDSSENLCSHVADAMSGHGLAWVEAGVLHRDVSPENILIDEDPEGGSRDRPEGFLHDWDLCKYKEEIDSGPAQEIRSGTWPFVSSLLLYYPNKQHDLADDLESFVHIIYWFAIRFHHHGLTPVQIAMKLSNIYLHAEKVNGFDIGSEDKITLMKSGKPCFVLNNSNQKVNKGLRVIVEKLAQYCQEHYDTVDFQALHAGRARVLGLPIPEDAPPTKRAGKNRTAGSTRAALWGVNVATLPDDDSDKKGSDDEVTPLSPFSSHKLVLSMLNAATGRASYWMVDDKLEDKFDGAVSQSMFNGRGNTHHSSQVSAGKRSASTVFEDDGPSQKRSRTSGQIADSDNESIASTLSQETGSSRKLKVKGIRSIPMEPTVPEEEETGDGGASMDGKM
ncbi:hypothetical protein ABKN59_001612 [Abortiporus biennis]